MDFRGYRTREVNPTAKRVGNTRCRFMYQMAVLNASKPWREAIVERSTGTEIDEVRRFTGAPIGVLRPGRGGSVSERPSGAGATATKPTVSACSARRAPVDEVARVLELFTRYWDLTAALHEKLVADHGFAATTGCGELASPQARGAQAVGRTGASKDVPCPMMLHQDGSEPRVGPVDGGT